jgi:hypothetical protein
VSPKVGQDKLLKLDAPPQGVLGKDDDAGPARARGWRGHDRRETEGKCMTDHGYRISYVDEESMGNGMKSRQSQ